MLHKKMVEQHFRDDDVTNYVIFSKKLYENWLKSFFLKLALWQLEKAFSS